MLCISVKTLTTRWHLLCNETSSNVLPVLNKVTCQQHATCSVLLFMCLHRPQQHGPYTVVSILAVTCYCVKTNSYFQSFTYYKAIRTIHDHLLLFWANHGHNLGLNSVQLPHLYSTILKYKWALSV